EALFALAGAGVHPGGVIDPRADSLAAQRARALGIEVHSESVVTAVHGRASVKSVTVAHRDRTQERRVAADCLILSGGYSPVTSLASQLGAPLRWDRVIAAFVPDLETTVGRLAGAARGVFGIASAARDGEATARLLAGDLEVAPIQISPAAQGPELPPDAEA